MIVSFSSGIVIRNTEREREQPSIDAASYRSPGIVFMPARKMVAWNPRSCQKNTIETTGAGDTFCGCAIHGLLKYGLEGLTEESLGEILSYANAGAALITMKKGAIRSMPEPSEIEALQA